MSLGKKILMILLLSIAGLMAFFYSSISDTFYTATGFSAKNVCSGHFISGFPPELVRQEALVPVSKFFSYVSYIVDNDEQSVSTSVLGLFRRKAVYRKGIGCTLLAANEDKLERTVYPLAPLTKNNKFILENDDSIPLQKNRSINKVLDLTFKTNPQRNIKAIVILHDGKIISEKYANGVNSQTPLLSWSMAKSITALLVGVLVKDQQLDIYSNDLLPEWSNLSDHKEINLDHLLRMSSGLEFNETYGIGSDAAKMLSIEPNAGAFASHKALEYPIDTHWSYSSGTTNIISTIIKNEVAKDGNDSFQFYYEFPQQRLFRRLGIESALLETDSEGIFIGSSYAYMTARDWAKLGQFCLQDGVWNGKSILPKGWMKYVTTPTKTNKSNSYGAHFWLNRVSDDPNVTRRWPSLPKDLYLMSGFQGQTVAMIPSMKLVVVRLGFTPPGVERGTEELIKQIIKIINSEN